MKGIASVISSSFGRNSRPLPVYGATSGPKETGEKASLSRESNRERSKRYPPGKKGLTGSSCGARMIRCAYFLVPCDVTNLHSEAGVTHGNSTLLFRPYLRRRPTERVWVDCAHKKIFMRKALFRQAFSRPCREALLPQRLTPFTTVICSRSSACYVSIDRHCTDSSTYIQNRVACKNLQGQVRAAGKFSDEPYDVSSSML